MPRPGIADAKARTLFHLIPRESITQGRMLLAALRGASLRGEGVSDKDSGLQPWWRRGWLAWGVLVALLVVLLVQVVAWEVRTSTVQGALHPAALAKRLYFRVEPGPSPAIRFPRQARSTSASATPACPAFVSACMARDSASRRAGAAVAGAARPRRARLVRALPRKIASRSEACSIAAARAVRPRAIRSASMRTSTTHPAAGQAARLPSSRTASCSTRTYPMRNPAVEWDAARQGRARPGGHAWSTPAIAARPAAARWPRRSRSTAIRPTAAPPSMQRQAAPDGSASLRAYLRRRGHARRAPADRASTT